MLNHVLERVEPSHVLVAFDAGKTTFRTEMYADYKGGRAKTPDEFREQFPFIRELLDHLGIRHYELAQYEADDIIGTLGRLAEKILSMWLSLVEIGFDPVDGWAYSGRDFQERCGWVWGLYTRLSHGKMGLTPAQFIDLKGSYGG